MSGREGEARPSRPAPTPRGPELLRKGCCPGSCSYRWVGTVLKASSLDLFTPTFCKFKDKNKMLKQRSDGQPRFCSARGCYRTQRWASCDVGSLKMLCVTQGKTPAPVRIQVGPHPSARSFTEPSDTQKQDLCCQWNASLRLVPHQVWQDSWCLYTTCKSHCYSF